jgi:CHAD domain-containing protein
LRVSSELKKYFKKRIELINASLEKPQRLFTPVDYHKLRVEIKKVKALFGVIEYSTKDFHSEVYFKIFKLLFKKAGRVRELQLERQAVENYKQPAFREYLKYLEEERDKEADNFFSLVNDELKKDLRSIYKSIIHFFDHVHKKEIENYISNRKRKIIRFISRRNNSDMQIHGIRKLLKEFFYIKKMIISKDIPVLRIEEFQELLGQWHDNLIMTDHLQKVVDEGSVGIQEKKRLASLKKIIDDKKDHLFEKINEMKPVFVQSFRLQS